MDGISSVTEGEQAQPEGTWFFCKRGKCHMRRRSDPFNGLLGPSLEKRKTSQTRIYAKSFLNDEYGFPGLKDGDVLGGVEGSSSTATSDSGSNVTRARSIIARLSMEVPKRRR